MARDTTEISDSAPILPSDPNIFEITVFKNHRISICKPLIPLKLVFFIYYGAGSFMISFITVLYKERGVSLSEMSTITLSAPLFQFIGTAVSGIIADKIGKSKPVYAVNVGITIIFVLGIIFLPPINTTFFSLKCHQNETELWTSCGTIKDTFEIEWCHGYCLDEFADKCLLESSNCKNIDYSKELNTSLTIHVSNTPVQKIKELCQYKVLALTSGNSPHSWCPNKYCAISCHVHRGIEIVDDFNWLIIVYGGFYILFLTAFSNSYRCLDVACTFLVEEHNSSFGQERCFAMLGHAMIAPVAGYIAHITAEPGHDRNYCSTFYLYIAMCCVMLPILYKLPMKVRPREKAIRQKVWILTQRLDFWVFFVTLIILGTATNFKGSFLFWYLEGMRASSLLLGLILSLEAFYGLPFLWFSKRIVEKIGTTQIFLLALLAHTVNSMGYSSIENPSYSLILEMTGIMTYILLWVSAVQYSHDIAPEGLTATVIAIAGAIHFSIGKFPAGLMGIYIMYPYGGRVAFQSSAGLTLSAAALYGSYLCIKKKCDKEDKYLKSPGFGAVYSRLKMEADDQYQVVYEKQ